MFIRSISIQNFRGISDLTIDLDRHVNVFIGSNGSGKSTILDAVKILLSWFSQSVINKEGLEIEEDWIKNDSRFALLSIRIEYAHKEYSWSICKWRTGVPEVERRTIGSKLDGANLLANDVLVTLSKAEKGKGFLPICLHYSVDRMIKETMITHQAPKKYEIWNVYQDSFQADFSFERFFLWFKYYEEVENEKRLKNYETFMKIFQSYRERVGEAHGMEDDPSVYEAIRNEQISELKIIRSVLGQLLPRFSNLTVKREPLRMELQKENEVLNVNQLSDGEKSLLLMVCSIAQYLTMINSSVSSLGVISIDEIELHLHPEWQQMVIPNLHKTFPNCQFLFTTHSPRVISEVKPKHIFKLTKNEDKNIVCSHPKRSYGLDVSEVLEEVMDTPRRNPEIAKRLTELFDLIDDEKLEDAKQKLKEIREEVGTDLPDLVGAESLLEALDGMDE